MKLGTIYGSLGIISLISSAGALDTDMPITAVILVIAFIGFMYFAMREEGYIRKKSKKNVLPPTKQCRTKQ